jgi:hypothetical protein
MDEEKRLAIFLSEFDFQIDQIIEIYEKLEQKIPDFEKQTPSKPLIESAGYWLHNLYSAYEDLFKLVCGFWENNISTNGDYHINLLKRMVIAIEGIRPAMLSDACYRNLNELRGFRHVFRHAYAYGLDDERVSVLLRKTVRNQEAMLRDIKTFRSKMEKLRQG